MARIGWNLGTRDPHFGFEVPLHVPDVPDGILDPKATWRDGTAYDEAANRLKSAFREAFREFENKVPAEVRAAAF